MLVLGGHGSESEGRKRCREVSLGFDSRSRKEWRESEDVPLDIHQWRIVVHDAVGDQLVELRNETNEHENEESATRRRGRRRS